MRKVNLLFSSHASFFTNHYNKTTLSSSSILNNKFYTSSSKPQNPNHNHPLIQVTDDDDDDDDVSSAELKKQIDKFYEGDYEAIPTIFESILKRKLSGKHQESDDELMNEFRHNQSTQVKDSHSSDTDSDSDVESVK